MTDIQKSNKIVITDEQFHKILSGDTSAASTKKKNVTSTKKNLQLRLETDLIERIDESRKRRSVPIPRHTWLLEAIHEKLTLNQL
jgi:hypothetical protein